MATPGGAGAGSARGRPPAFEYFTLNTIMDNLINFIHGPQPDRPNEQNGETQSAFSRLLADNPLDDGKQESEQRAKDYRTWLEDAIQDHVMQPGFNPQQRYASRCSACQANRRSGVSVQRTDRHVSPRALQERYYYGHEVDDIRTRRKLTFRSGPFAVHLAPSCPYYTMQLLSSAHSPHRRSTPPQQK